MAKNIGMTLYYDWFDSLDMLDPDEAWKLIKAIVLYCRDGIEPPVFENVTVEMAKSFMLAQIRRAEFKAQAGRLGGIASGKSKREKKQNEQNGGADDNGGEKDQPAPASAEADNNEYFNLF